MIIYALSTQGRTSLSEGLCQEGISVKVGGLYPGVSLQGTSVWGSSVKGESLSGEGISIQGVSVQGDLF